MTDRAMLFSGAMVRALLEGRKSQTRRLVTPATCEVLGSKVTARSPAWQGLKFDHPVVKVRQQSTIGLVCFGADAPFDLHLDVPWIHPDDEARGLRWEDDQCMYRVRPIYQSGDLIWVRERLDMGHERPGFIGLCTYKADEAPVDLRPAGAERWAQQRKQNAVPAIHMPRWASRLTLEVTEVRVQRLQDISEADAVGEGMGVRNPRPDHVYAYWDSDPLDEFCELWDSLNAKRAPWESNPWVVAITFTVHQQNIDAFKQHRSAA